MKRILSTFFVMLLLPIAAHSYDAKIDGIYYNFSGNEATVTYQKYQDYYCISDYSGSVVIPSSVVYSGKTYSVTSIGEWAFSGCSGLTSLTIPNSVKSFGWYAFSYCSGLTSITIPNSVTSISEDAFYNCYFTTDSFINNSSLTNSNNWGAILYGGVETNDGLIINNNCVIKCRPWVTSIAIPNGVTSIGDLAFYNCNGLTSITIPNSVTSIGRSAFYGCSSLTSITIPNSVTRIDSSVFYGCRALISITIPNSVTSIGEGAFLDCSGLTSVTIPNSVTNIGQEAFNGCGIKKMIWLPNTPPSGYNNISGAINYVANEQYTNLNNKVVYPFLSSMFEVDGIKYVPVNPSERTCDAIDCLYDESVAKTNIGPTVSYKGITMNVQKIQPYLCYNNKFIESLECENSGDIAYYAFQGCTGITSVKCNNSGNIGSGAFSGCTSITSAECNNGGEIGQYAFSGCTSIAKAVCNNSGEIGDKAFYECDNITDLTLGEEVSSIGSCAFQNCSSLQTVIIPNSVTSLGGYSFSNCSLLDNLVLGNQVETIGSSAFSGCSSLPTIRIPMNVTSITDNVFNNCTSLRAVLMDDGETGLSLGSNGSNPLFADCPLDSVYIGRNITYSTASDKGYSPFYGNTKLRIVVISDKETEITAKEFYGCSGLEKATINNQGRIRDEAFSGCSTLQTAELGEKITSIGNNAFYGCSKLESMAIPDSVTSLGNNVFENCSSMTSVKIGNGVKTIPTYAFSGCSSLPTIQIPQNVTNIGDYVFNGCTSLKTVLMDDGETGLSLGSNGSNPLFYSCPLDSVYIGRNITYPTASNKGYSPFYRNTNLRSVTITDKETEVSQNEFYGCTNLKNVRLGNGITTIGDWAFSGCSSLDFFSFGASVESIGKEAFSDCTSMTKLYAMTQVPPNCGDQALDDINKWECTLMVPEGYVTAYQAAPQWKEFFFMEEFDPDGIEAITASEEASEVARYDLQGRQIVNGKSSNSKLQRGINIIRYSDGTTRKVLMK